MRSGTRDKNIRANRRARSAKPDPDHTQHVLHQSPVSNSMESGLNPVNYVPGLNNPAQIPDPSSNSAQIQPRYPVCDHFWTEEQLEDLLLKNLELIYNEAITQLTNEGYEEEVVLKAILHNGFCYGGSDVLNNILSNTRAYLSNSTDESSSHQGFPNLRQLEEYSLAGMICLLQQVKPHLTKGNAMWCLLTNDLNVAKSSAMDFPPNPNPGANPSFCNSFGSETTTQQKEIDLPKRFTLSPSLKSLLQRNVTAFAAGFRANTKQNTSTNVVINDENQNQNPKTQERVNSALLSKFRDLNLEESVSDKDSFDKKDEMILTMLQQIKELEKQVTERKEWAHEKAIQAAKKLVNDLTELKKLKSEKEESSYISNIKPALDQTTLKKLQEMELDLRRASAKVDQANTNVRKLEIENAEIRAEMEASKLSASESVNSCLELTKKEKKYEKRLLAWEKQKVKMQDEIAKEKQRILDMKQEIAEFEAATKDIEVKRIQTQKENEEALAKVEEAKRLLEESSINSKRTIESVRQKIEMDFKRDKDDIQRLEQEYSRLVSQNEEKYNNKEEDVTVASLLSEFEGKSGISYDRECLICGKDEASVVFLPCTHQVVCGKCNEKKKGGGRNVCVRCGVLVEKRVKIFGASS